jgi:hypothetical protein
LKEIVWTQRTPLWSQDPCSSIKACSCRIRALAFRFALYQPDAFEHVSCFECIQCVRLSNWSEYKYVHKSDSDTRYYDNCCPIQRVTFYSREIRRKTSISCRNMMNLGILWISRTKSVVFIIRKGSKLFFIILATNWLNWSGVFENNLSINYEFHF